MRSLLVSYDIPHYVGGDPVGPQRAGPAIAGGSAKIIYVDANRAEEARALLAHHSAAGSDTGRARAPRAHRLRAFLERSQRRQTPRTDRDGRIGDVALLVRFLTNAAALFAAAYVVPGFRVEGWRSLLLLALIFGAVNALVRPFVRLLACGIIVLTLGLFTFVINAAMLALAAWIGREAGLAVSLDGFGAAFLAAFVVSTVSLLLSWVLPDGEDRPRVQVVRHRDGRGD